MSQFLQDVVAGLSGGSKYLHSKYFYDAAGDALFQQIMKCPEYYLTRCELEIFKNQTAELVSCFTTSLKHFDVVELGAGDATKSFYLLQEMLKQKIQFTYIPVDISSNVIEYLENEFPVKLPGLQVTGLNGEYFSMLQKVKNLTSKNKVVLFLGSNIGNIPLEQTGSFCRELRAQLLPGDFVLIGFDLKKNPATILAAYNDEAGFTRDFNLNLLKRINRELGGNFDLNLFTHYPSYDPETGACKSYLISACDQAVRVSGHTFYLAKHEHILMEVSQKYTTEQLNEFARLNGFRPIRQFLDSKNWFADAVWQCV